MTGCTLGEPLDQERNSESLETGGQNVKEDDRPSKTKPTPEGGLDVLCTSHPQVHKMNVIAVLYLEVLMTHTCFSVFKTPCYE